MTKIASLYGNTIFRTMAALVVIGLYFFGLTVPLLGPDEPRYAQVAREMFERGDWITPTLGGFHWFEKPALLYWLQIASYNVFGISEFSARFGSALFGLGTVYSLYLLGRSFTRATKNAENDFAFLLASVSASSIGLMAFARGASFDIVLTFPMTAAMVSFFIFELGVDRSNGSKKSRVYIPLFLFYFFIGLSLLAKGLIGVVFPFAIVAFYYVLSWRLPSRTLLLSFVWGTAVAVIVAAAWYLPMYTRHGWEFIDEFFIQHHFQRYTSNKYLHPQPFYFFFLILPAMTIPWLPFFFAAIWRYGKARIGQVVGLKEMNVENPDSDIENNEQFGDLVRFAFAWMLVPLVFFSFSGSKLPGYILPSLAPALILAALHLDRFIRRRPGRQCVALSTAGATFLIAAALLVFILPRFADTDSVKRLIETANARGYGDAKVLTFHTVSHNAEFYASGRLLRDADGKQRKLVSVHEIRNEMEKNGWETVLVLVPMEYSKQLNETTVLSSETLADNGEYLIAKVDRATS